MGNSKKTVGKELSLSRIGRSVGSVFCTLRYRYIIPDTVINWRNKNLDTVLVLSEFTKTLSE